MCDTIEVPRRTSICTFSADGRDLRRDTTSMNRFGSMDALRESDSTLKRVEGWANNSRG